MRTAKVKKWAEFQHYKNRCPPWIKLQKSILDDFDFACLPIASKALAPLLWLLASESTDGEVRIDPDWLAFRLRFSVDDVRAGLTPLIEKGFLIVASGVLAECLQDACLEGEGETEGEGDIEPKGSSASAGADAPPAAPKIPYQAIVDAYNTTMTNLPRVRELTPKRRTLIRSAWQASRQRQGMEFWGAYFAECQDDPFLNGTGPYRPPHDNWRPSFDYLLKADVVTKVFEAAMDRMERES